MSLNCIMARGCISNDADADTHTHRHTTPCAHRIDSLVLILSAASFQLRCAYQSLLLLLLVLHNENGSKLGMLRTTRGPYEGNHKHPKGYYNNRGPRIWGPLEREDLQGTHVFVSEKFPDANGSLREGYRTALSSERSYQKPQQRRDDHMLVSAFILLFSFGSQRLPDVGL